jgi:hypothetical protein
VRKWVSLVIPSEDAMSLRLATKHENGCGAGQGGPIPVTSNREDDCLEAVPLCGDKDPAAKTQARAG